MTATRLTEVAEQMPHCIYCGVAGHWSQSCTAQARAEQDALRREAELDQAIALLQDVRQRVVALRTSLEGYDLSLASPLYPLLGKIESHLGACLLKREDGRA